jgi:hypothetical protein
VRDTRRWWRAVAGPPNIFVCERGTREGGSGKAGAARDVHAGDKPTPTSLRLRRLRRRFYFVRPQAKLARYITSCLIAGLSGLNSLPQRLGG